VPSPAPVATPTAADTESSDTSAVFGKSVPAHGSFELPVDFEGSSWGAISIYARSKGLTATFAGKALDGRDASLMGAGLWSFSSGLTKPANGVLVVRNPGAKAIDIQGGVSILTRRHLTVTVPNLEAHRGDKVGFDVTLSLASETDEAKVELISANGLTRTPVAVTKVAPGHWTGLVTLTDSGDIPLMATVTVGKFRTTHALLQVMSGDVKLSSTFTERLDDTNGGGKDLLIIPTITVPRAGRYHVVARLEDAAGHPAALTYGDDQILKAGSQPFNLRFYGAEIRMAGISGPYHIREVRIWNMTSSVSTLEVSIADYGVTQAYDSSQF
jgi:hypothetical protein